MSTVKLIAKNTTLILISQISTLLMGFFTLVYMARYLGAEGFGILSLALSMSGIFAIIVDMGLGTLMIREVARIKLMADKYIPNVALMKVILSFFTLGLVVLIVNIIRYPEIVSIIIYIITLSVIINSFTAILSSIFQANQKMAYISISTIINSASMLLGTLIGIYYHFEIIYFAALYVISNILVFAFITSTYKWKFHFPKIKIDWSLWKPTIKESWPFAITSLSGMLYTYIDSIMLSIIKGTVAVGWYSAAYRFMLMVLFIPTTLNIVIFPVMSKHFKSSNNTIKMINEKYFKYMIIIGIPLGFGTTILANKIILLIYGIEYTQSIIALQILIWTIVFTFTGASFVQVLQSINKQLIITKISGICVIINIILNLILIPKFSYIGASIATVLTEIILVGYTISITYKLGYGIDHMNVRNDLAKVLVAASIMSIFILYFKSLNLFLLITIAIILYFIVLYLLKIFDEMDVFLIKEIFNRNK
jgi:O-antigen/teichoic acid export membrane protein